MLLLMKPIFILIILMVGYSPIQRNYDDEYLGIHNGQYVIPQDPILALKRGVGVITQYGEEDGYFKYVNVEFHSGMKRSYKPEDLIILSKRAIGGKL